MIIQPVSSQTPQPNGARIEALHRVRDLIYQVSGIFHPETRLRFLEERCARRMDSLNIFALERYLEVLTIRPGRVAEVNALLNEITVGETCFFRNQPQLDALQNTVIPLIAATKTAPPLRHLRIWSAGCSTGEEPYTLAMILLEQTAGALKGFTFEVIATDLNERSLAHAQAASYGEYALRNVSAYYRQKYFVEGRSSAQLKQSVTSKVRFSRVNLLDDARMAFLKGMDIVLCCNVLIYFDAASKRRVMQHFYNSLLPGSYLFLGHSESLFGLTDNFRLVHFPGATAYLKPVQGSLGGR